MSMRRYTVSIDDRSFVIDVVETAADRFEVSVDGQTFEATLHGDHDLPGSDISPEIPATEARASSGPAGLQLPLAAFTTPPISSPPVPPAPTVRPGAAPIRRAAAASPGASRVATLTAPMPGVVLEVLVAAGARLKRGDPILVLEAMKMRNTIRSPHDALVVEVAVAAGQPVGPGDPLVRLDPGG